MLCSSPGCIYRTGKKGLWNQKEITHCGSRNHERYLDCEYTIHGCTEMEGKNLFHLQSPMVYSILSIREGTIFIEGILGKIYS
jgi:hypothetical protein